MHISLRITVFERSIRIHVFEYVDRENEIVWGSHIVFHDNLHQIHPFPTPYDCNRRKGLWLKYRVPKIFLRWNLTTDRFTFGVRRLLRSTKPRAQCAVNKSVVLTHKSPFDTISVHRVPWNTSLARDLQKQKQKILMRRETWGVRCDTDFLTSKYSCIIMSVACAKGLVKCLGLGCRLRP